MISFIRGFNAVVFVVLTICYSYQIAYLIISLVRKSKVYTAKKLHRYAVLISARNESAVIAQLIDSIKRQDYPEELIDIYVVADNCTDNTAQVAEEAGAVVYERFDTSKIGKGYALDYLLKAILKSHGADEYEGYFVFDADNLLDSKYVFEMNSVFDQGYRIVTGYRNSKNYDTNWISAGYSLWFLRESKYLNNSRMLFGTSSAISGTGFLVHSDIINANGGWIHHTLTEDIEFTVDNVINGEIIGYSGGAVLYDEQPVTFNQSWFQRLRWAKGFYQVVTGYGVRLIKGICKGKSFSCFDMLMTVSPAVFLSVAAVLVNAGFLVYAVIGVNSITIFNITLSSILHTLVYYYISFFIVGAITAATEWNNIQGASGRKLRYMFTFPLFMLTYIPIAIVALFKKVEWKPISHNVVKSIEEFH